MKIKWTIIGLVLSLACAIHCILMPIILIAFPIIFNSLEHHEIHWEEWVLVGTSLVIGFFTLHHSYKKHHQNPFSLLAFFIAAICMLTSFFPIHLDTILFNIGNIFLLISYLLNFWYQRKAKPSCKH
ncbi:MAG: MerC domain-containing protein [Chitinophagaceae bacterium]